MPRRIGPCMVAATLAAVLTLGPAGAQPGPAIRFVAPADGSTVAGPKVEVFLEAVAFTLVDAGLEVKAHEGHPHLFVDRDPVPAGETIPTDQPNIVHLGRAPYDARSVELAIGRHTLAAQLADSSHVAIDAPAPKVTFTVAPGFRGTGTLENACAEVAKGAGTARVVFPSGGGQAQGVLDTRCTFTTESGTCSWAAVSTRRMVGSFDARSRQVSGELTGSSRRILERGDRSRCGSDDVTPSPPSPFAASFDGQTLSGTLGQARFVVRSDPQVSLATPGPSPAAATPAPPGAGTSGGSRLGVVLVLALAAAVAAGAVAARRRTPRRVPVPTVPASGDAIRFCSECGAERRTGSRFCTVCGAGYD